MKNIFILIAAAMVLSSCTAKPVNYTSVTEESLDAFLNAYPAYVKKAHALGYEDYRNSSVVAAQATAPRIAKELNKELMQYRLTPETFGLLLERVMAGYTQVQMEKQMAGQGSMFGDLLGNMFKQESMISENEQTVIKNNFAAIQEMFEKVNESLRT